MAVCQLRKHAYKWCVICTLLMAITSILNVVHITYRFLSTNNTIYKSMITISALSAQNYLTKTTRQYNSRLFDETYHALQQSAEHNLLLAYDRLIQPLIYCPPVPPDLKGPVAVQEPPKEFSLLNKSIYHSKILFGGHYHPETCVARHKVAIIVPYRNRWDILGRFLFHTHTILQRQQIDYRIYICEQAFNKTFNKGIVMNACFKEILKFQPDTRCFIMHDVDLLLIDDRNMYTCPRYPRHLSVSIDKFHFYLPYAELVGGVLGMSKE